MIQPHQSFDFLLELFLEPRVVQRIAGIFQQDFDDHATIHQLRVARQIHHTNAASPKLAFDQVTVFQ